MITVTYLDGTVKKYETFDDIMDDGSVTKINCSHNQLTELPENMIFPNLQKFNCS